MRNGGVGGQKRASHGVTFISIESRVRHRQRDQQTEQNVVFERSFISIESSPASRPHSLEISNKVGCPRGLLNCGLSIGSARENAFAFNASLPL
jgi:hypothetical protein